MFSLLCGCPYLLAPKRVYKGARKASGGHGLKMELTEEVPQTHEIPTRCSDMEMKHVLNHRTTQAHTRHAGSSTPSENPTESSSHEIDLEKQQSDAGVERNVQVKKARMSYLLTGPLGSNNVTTENVSNTCSLLRSIFARIFQNGNKKQKRNCDTH